MGKGWERFFHIHDLFLESALVLLFDADCCDVARCLLVCDAVWSGSNIQTFWTNQETVAFTGVSVKPPGHTLSLSGVYSMLVASHIVAAFQDQCGF